MVASVARSHGDDGAGDPPRPPRGLGSNCQRNARKRPPRKATGNYALKKAVENYGPQKIDFELNDQQTMRHVGKNAAWFGNYVGELVRGFPYYWPSWRDIPAEDKAHIYPRLRFHFEIDRHLNGPRGEDIRKGIEDYFSTRYSDNKHNHKLEHWVGNGGATKADAIRANRPENVTQESWNRQVDFWIDPKRAHRAAVNARNRRANKISTYQGSRSLAATRHEYFENNNQKYPGLIQSYYDMHTVEDVWQQPEAKQLYEEMLRLKALGTMTEEEILAKVIGGKQRGHIAGRGRRVAGVGRRDVFSSGNEGTPFYSQREINEMMKKHKEELDAQKLANKKQQENFEKMVAFLSQSQGMSELANMFPGSTTEVGSTSGTSPSNNDPSTSGNPGDDGDDGEDQNDLWAFQ